MEYSVAALQSQEFLEGAGLILVAAILTGMLVPLIKSRMDQTAFKKQRLFEAAIARQSRVIGAQTSFLAEFSKDIWEYHMRLQKVSHYRIVGDDEEYQKALAEYKNAVWDSLHKLRSAIGSASWFTSDETHQALTSYYESWFVRLDQTLREFIDGDYDTERWRQRHFQVHYEAGTKNYALLRQLADEFGLRDVNSHAGDRSREAPPS